MNSAIVELDLHGMNLDQARDAVDAALRKADMSVYRVRVIHGHNHGVAIRDMIRREYNMHYKVMRVSRGPIEGQTDLVLREY